MEKRCAISVFGRVQGVFFRAEAKKEADKAKITGFVLNKIDGSVYLEVQGEDEALADFIKWCRKGPPNARVKEIKIKEIALRNEDEFVVM